METWLKIKGFSTYEVSSLGRLKTYNWKNKGKEAIIKPARDKSGYLRTMLKRDIDGKFVTIKVHRIVSMMFLENPLNKPHVNHINGIKDDNRTINLEWVTVSENIKHSFSIGNHSVVGEKNPAATITEKEVLEIRSVYPFGRKCLKKGEISKRDLADKYGVSVYCIKNIVTNKTWRHLL